MSRHKRKRNSKTRIAVSNKSYQVQRVQNTIEPLVNPTTDLISKPSSKLKIKRTPNHHLNPKIAMAHISTNNSDLLFSHLSMCSLFLCI